MDGFDPTRVNFRMATLNDLDSITRIHCASFSPENSIPVLLGEKYVKATYKWHINYPGAHVIVAVIDEVVIGFAGICDGSYFKPMFIACLGEFLLSLFKKPALIFKRDLWKRFSLQSYLVEKRSVLLTYPDIAQLTNGAVEVDYRRTSVLTTMVNKLIEVNKNRGSRAVRVGVYKSNMAIRNFFVKSGWQEIPELETVDTMQFITFIDPNLKEEFSFGESS